MNAQPEVLEALEDLCQSVLEYIVEVDALMIGPANYERGRQLGTLINKLSEALAESECAIKKAKQRV
jgi:hypothetical protein